MAYDNVKQVVEEYGIAKAAFEEKMKNAFNDIFKTFFSQFPEIQAVGWDQYTPYFNDGDPCEFSVHDKWGVAGLSEDEFEELNKGYELEELPFPYTKPSKFDYEYQNKYESCRDKVQAYEKIAGESRHKEVCEGYAELLDVLDSIPEEIYLNAFGDHAFILATKDGIEIRERDHD